MAKLPLRAISESSGEALEYAPYGLNLYHGCPHGCAYCFAPGTKRTSREEFSQNTGLVKKATLENLEHDLQDWQGERSIVHLCFLCDPYPIGRDSTETRKYLEMFRKYDHPFQVLTKGGMPAARDFDLYGHNDRFGVTLTFDNDTDSQKWEPQAALPADRIEVLRTAHEKGIRTWVSLEPVIDPVQTLHLVDLTYGFVDHYGVGKLNHNTELEKTIDWSKFRADAESKLKGYRKNYKIKAALKVAAPDVNFDAVPAELTTLKQFCIRAEKQPYIHDGKTKNTFTATGWTDRPNDLLTFDEAVEALEKGVSVWHNGGPQKVEGIGFIVRRSDDDDTEGGVQRPLGGDLDCCVNPVTGFISKWALSHIENIRPFYTKVSPSKCGLRFFVWGHLPADSIAGYGPQDGLSEDDKMEILKVKPDTQKFNHFELYEHNRHLTITGNRLDKYCFLQEDRTKAIADDIWPLFLDQIGDEIAGDLKKESSSRGKLPKIDILKVIDTTGFTKSCRRLMGPHPITGSTGGKNLVVWPDNNTWAYMHDFRGGHAPGGDTWFLRLSSM